ncbi:hypothetical protein B0I35DRAFT_438525 [Stachybotrys elegans]|uniref:Uncharacterized protein n=1 Tax=Stachybotrys elegans TaxID=80388 RepID=A0A8K0SGP1_9HYPO|nr:hypothetical protein B0I35DRAFT_438525 [Stachybotrys elegans]
MFATSAPVAACRSAKRMRRRSGDLYLIIGANLSDQARWSPQANSAQTPHSPLHRCRIRLLSCA